MSGHLETHLMSNVPQFHIVHKSINRLLTIWGAERRLFFLALVGGGAAFNFFGSLATFRRKIRMLRRVPRSSVRGNEARARREDGWGS